MYTLGHTFVPAGIHAGGLRYHGMAPACVRPVRRGLYRGAWPYHAEPGVRGGDAVRARPKGIIPAPESAHAIRAAIDEALEAKEAGEKRVILFNLSGHGHFDLGAYDSYLAGKLTNHEHPQDEIEEALEHLPKVG